VKVLKVINEMTMIQINKDFGKNTRISVSDLRKVRFWDKEAREAFECIESRGASITASIARGRGVMIVDNVRDSLYESTTQ
jgi:hypothetical protein